LSLDLAAEWLALLAGPDLLIAKLLKSATLATGRYAPRNWQWIVDQWLE